MALKVALISTSLNSEDDLSTKLTNLLDPLSLNVDDVVLRSYGNDKEKGIIVIYDDTGFAIADDFGGSGGGTVISALEWKASVLDKDLTAPPGGESPGDRYIVGPGATGAWATHDDEIAEWNGSSWDFTIPQAGFAVYVVDETQVYVYDGDAWRLLATGISDHGDLAGLADDDHEHYHNSVTVGSTGRFNNFKDAVDHLNANNGGILILLDSTIDFGSTDLDLSRLIIMGSKLPDANIGSLGNVLSFDGTGHIIGASAKFSGVSCILSDSAGDNAYIIEDDVDKVIVVTNSAWLALDLSFGVSNNMSLVNNSSNKRVTIYSTDASAVYVGLAVNATRHFKNGAGTTVVNLETFDRSTVDGPLDEINDFEFDASLILSASSTGGISSAMFRSLSKNIDWTGSSTLGAAGLFSQKTLESVVQELADIDQVDFSPIGGTGIFRRTYATSSSRTSTLSPVGEWEVYLSNEVYQVTFEEGTIVSNGTFLSIFGGGGAGAEQSYGVPVDMKLVGWTISHDSGTNGTFDIIVNNLGSDVKTISVPSNTRHYVQDGSVSVIGDIDILTSDGSSQPGLRTKIDNQVGQKPDDLVVTLYMRAVIEEED